MWFVQSLRTPRTGLALQDFGIEADAARAAELLSGGPAGSGGHTL